MKKLLLLLPIFLVTGCASLIGTHHSGCVGVHKFEIIQALDDGALAYVCTFWDEKWNRPVVFISQKNNNWYDKSIIRITDGYCPIYEGVYRYTNKDSVFKTVRKVEIVKVQKKSE